MASPAERIVRPIRPFLQGKFCRESSDPLESPEHAQLGAVLISFFIKINPDQTRA